MRLTEISIKRPLFIIMVVLAMVILGGISYTRLGADQYPDINIPYVSAVVVYPGAGPTEVEDRITIPLEEALAGASNIKTLYSFSMDSVSAVILQFNENTDTDFAANEVERRIRAIRASLPEDAQDPAVAKIEYNALPIVTLALYGERSSQELYELANDKLRPRLETVPGVAGVRVVGGREREVQVKADPGKLRAYGLAIQQLAGAIAQSNVSIPSGSVTEGGSVYNVRYASLYQSVDQLANLVLANTRTGIIRVSDVANVSDGLKEQQLISRFNGQDSVGLLITKQATANTMKVADGVKEALARIESGLPAGARVSVASDTSVYIRASLDSVQYNLLEAIALTAIVLLLFLHTMRSTIIVLFSIPTSLISTFLVMWVLGFTLNMMSMLALALTIGILVDDSIVVLENIFRHLGMGKTPWRAALEGRGEIGLAAITITLVDVVVYVPIAFMTGLVGQFFREFGLTTAAATLISLFISFTLTPMLASRWLKAGEGERVAGKGGGVWGFWDRGYGAFLRGYRRTLGWSLRHREIVAGVAVASVVGAAILVPLNVIGTEFLPQEDQGQFNLMVDMPPGTSLAATNEVVLGLEAQLRKLPEIRDVFTAVGVSGSGFFVSSESNVARLAVRLVPQGERKRSVQVVARECAELGSSIPGARGRVQFPSIGEDPTQPFLVVIQGPDQNTLIKLGDQVVRIVKGLPGTADVGSGAGSTAQEVRVEAYPERLADLGLTSAQVGLALRMYLQGTVASYMRLEEGGRVDIRVMAKDVDKSSLASLANLPVSTSLGSVVNLGSIASLRMQQSPVQIERRDRQRTVTVGANVVGRPLGDVANDFYAATARLELPAGYSMKLAGQSLEMSKGFTELIIALVLSIVLIYMLLVSLYESLLYPFVIMFSLPVCICGVFGGLLLFGRTINISSLIGVIMLMGLAAKNGILLVDYTNTLRQRGMSREEAIKEAGPVRLRPILMTNLTMVAAMIPVVFQLSEGSEVRAPLATAVLGGLITSTVLSLLVIPVVYTYMDDLRTWMRARLPWGGGAGAEG